MIKPTPTINLKRSLIAAPVPLTPPVKAHTDVEDLKHRLHIKTRFIHHIKIQTRADNPTQPTQNI